MEQLFKIFVDRLKKEQSISIHEVVSPDFLDVNEEELHFQNEVTVDGEAYLADDELILHLSAEAEAVIPCAICNESVPTAVVLGEFYHAEPLKAIKGKVFDYQELLRESILLETPEFVECQGRCPKRETLQKYLKNETSDHQDQTEGYKPFSDLELN